MINIFLQAGNLTSERSGSSYKAVQLVWDWATALVALLCRLLAFQGCVALKKFTVQKVTHVYR